MVKTYYCPFCQKTLEPFKDEFGDVLIHRDPETLAVKGYIYLHDDVKHDPDWKGNTIQ